MTEIKVRTNLEVGFPRTPAYWVGEPTYEPITRIGMSCGGGMGGSYWHEYIKGTSLLEKIPEEKLIQVERIDGKRCVLNTKYIVSCEEFDLCTCTYYSGNPNFEQGITKYQFLLERGQEVELIDEFDRCK